MIKNKNNHEKMNKLKTFSLILLATVTVSNAQDIEQAKKAIDAEQYEKAKAMLKTLIQTKPDNGKAAFLLGNIYLKQNIEDSAKIAFQKGLTGADGARLNYIGLGQLDLDNNNTVAAQANFALATKDIKKKDIEEYVFIAKAYMNTDKPDFVNALATLNKAKAINPTDANVQLALGDAFYGQKNQNESYAAYRNAFQADNTLIRAKMQLGVLLKGAKSYDEALKAFNEVIVLNPNYGPVYRELAETYYKWAMNKRSKSEEYLKIAMGHYDKYMSLTDYSLTSRMRHADFLILVKDYAALEVEANKMKELDKVNPRILRYLGYSAYENGNVDLAIKSLDDFIAVPSNKIIARDYMYLGLSKLKKAINPDTKVVDPTFFGAGIQNIKKSVEMEISMTSDLSEVGKKLYEQKMYKEAAEIYEIAITNVESENHMLDNFYLANALYRDNIRKELAKPDPIALQKADTAFGKVIEASPTAQDAYFFRARVNSLLEKGELMTKYYEEYAKVVADKGPEELAKPTNKTKLIEAYNTIASNLSKTDKVKAREYFGKTLALDPTDAVATKLLKELK